MTTEGTNRVWSVHNRMTVLPPVGTSHFSTYRAHIQNHAGVIIATTREHTKKDDALDDAKILAAAPKLLASLIRLIAEFENVADDHTSFDAWRDACATVAEITKP